MSLFVFSLVLFSAFMHAGWNLFLKKSPDRLVTMATLHLVSSAIGMAAVPFLPIPNPESWPYIFTSVVLHLGYHLFLVKAYIYGDLGQVYPIARGISPLLLVVVSVFWIGEELSSKMMFAIGLITIGIFSLMFRGKIFFDHSWSFQKYSILASLEPIFTGIYIHFTQVGVFSEHVLQKRCRNTSNVSETFIIVSNKLKNIYISPNALFFMNFLSPVSLVGGVSRWCSPLGTTPN